MLNRSNQGYEYIIIGGGAMGVSTAFHLSHQSTSILVLDHPFPGSASRDFNKIVRFDYTDPFYMSLAYQARSEWMSSHLLKGYFHATGRVTVYDKDSQLSSIKANHDLNGLSILEDLSPADVVQKLGGLINCPNQSSLNATFNPLDAWVNFPQCVAAMLDQATSRGVLFKNGCVKELSFDNRGMCTGVMTTDEMIPCSGKVIVAAGAWTEKLLATDKSISGYDTANAKLSSYPVATGVCVVHFALNGEELEQFKGIPIFSYPGHGEILPPTENGILKMTVVKSFTNIDPELQISVPLETRREEELPSALEKEVHDFVDMICPKLSNHERNIRLYWDGMTVTQDPIIDTLPNNVVLASGGSYHMAKFLPIIGKFVVDEIGGQLGEPQKSKWAISNRRPEGLGNQPYLVPERDLHDLP